MFYFKIRKLIADRKTALRAALLALGALPLGALQGRAADVTGTWIDHTGDSCLR